MKVEWGAIKFRGDPVIVSKEISSLGDEVKPQQIVKYAEEHPDSELYKCFTWDDNRAAEKWRLHEARNIVLNLKVTYQDADEQPLTNEPVRLMLRTENTGGYKPTIKIVQNLSEREGMLRMAMAELQAFRKKYASLSELEKVFEAIDSL